MSPHSCRSFRIEYRFQDCMSFRYQRLVSKLIMFFVETGSLWISLVKEIRVHEDWYDFTLSRRQLFYRVSLSKPSADVKSGRIILGLSCSSDFLPLVGSLTSSQSAPNLLDSDPVDPTPLVTQNGQKSKASTPHTPETSSSTPGSADVFLQPQMSMGKSQGIYF